MGKEILKIVIKVLIYALGLVGAYLGVSACVSCSVNRELHSTGSGIGIFHYADTFRVNHGNSTTIKIN